MIHFWQKADSKLIQEELAIFIDDLQNDHNLDALVEALWALFTARCKHILAKHIPSTYKSVFTTLQPILGQRQNKKRVVKEKEILQEGIVY